MRQRLRAARELASSKQPGQIIVLFAVFLIVLMVLAGSAYDYASIVVDDAKLQNAVDASLLAGSDALSKNIIYGPTVASQAAGTQTATYLNSNGVVALAGYTTVNIAFPTSTPIALGLPTPVVNVLENIRLDVTRKHATAFWPLVGVPNVGMVAGGSAHAARGLVDVMLSLDTTKSMDAEFPALQSAVKQFVQAMNPTISDPRSPRIGMARWQGEKCTDNGSGATPRYTACKSDYTNLSPLSGNAADLIKLATNGPVASDPCPNGVLKVGAGLGFACPIDFHENPVGGGGTGTKLPNGIYAVSPTGVAGADLPLTTPAPPYAWATANGGRNDSPVGSGWAKKVLIMMTDGDDNDTYGRAGVDSTWDGNVVTAAGVLEAGPNTTIPEDDVEIYVINFQCSATETYSGGCSSELASVPIGTHECPGPPGALLPPSSHMSPTDVVLINSSSSKAGTCDHYYPLRKDENLPALFLQLAGTISRGALTE